MSKHERIVEVTCPLCGSKRNAELRDRGLVRACQSCSVSSARRQKKWNSTGVGHGESKTPLYRVWSAMIQRCTNPNNENYVRYGGRGIVICLEWMNFEAFRDWAFSHGYVKGLYIDRENNDGNYGPENCHWVTSAKSAFNRPQTKLSIAAIAVIKSLAQLGVPSNVVAALYGIDQRRISEYRDGKKFNWINSFVWDM